MEHNWFPLEFQLPDGKDALQTAQTAHVFDYLYLCGENEITLFTLESFKFAQYVDFVGNNIGFDNYKPRDDMLSAIKNFLMPDNPSTADIRSSSKPS